jgi:hypothetical protein
MADQNLTILYIFTLTGDGDGVDDIIIPISSFQANQRSGSPSYLTVVIPDIGYADDIAARLNGDLVINMVKLVDGSEAENEEILRANLESVRLDEGGVNQSITLSGHKQKTYTPKTVALEDVIYKSVTDDKRRYRCAVPNINLCPGDTATYDGDSFTVELITYTVNDGQHQIEIAEIDA